MGILAVVTIPHRSGIPKHGFSNSFAIGEILPGATAENDAAKDTLANQIRDLYTSGAATGGTSLAASYMASEVDGGANAASVKLYDITGHLDGSPHGSPVWVKPFTMPTVAPPSALGLPSEVAIAVTLEAAGRAGQQVEAPDGTDPGLAPDRPRQRYTGKFYFGPVRNSPDVAVNAPSGAMMVSGTVTTDLLDVVEYTAEQIYAAGPGLRFLGVWSRADQRIRSIDSVSVDDAFDTQRRRGASPTTRTRRAITVASTVELAS